MTGMVSGGGLKIEPIIMKQMEKKYFNTYGDASIWVCTTTEENDHIIRKENEQFYIFVRSNSQEKQTL